MENFDRFHKSVAYIDSLANLPLFAEYMKPGKQSHPEIYLKRMRYFLGLLGNPERGLKFVHITGTSGKGTVATMAHNSLVVSGKKVGLFTSPFVVCLIEKIQVGRQFISPEEFADLVEKIKPAIDFAYRSGKYGRPSHFEINFAVALLYFKQKKCEWAVLEVGCGGRYDATNIIPAPVLSAITCIDYDHTEILGKTLKKIAYDKAGIIKRGSKFFTTETRPELLSMFEKICQEKQANFRKIDPGVAGDSNRALAEALGKALGLSEKSIEKGISETRLAARFEKVSSKPVIILDGAHNRSKISHTNLQLKKERYKKLFLVMALAENKDSQEIFKQIVPIADEVFFTRFASKDRKPAPPLRLFKDAGPYLKKGVRTGIFLDSHDAFAEARLRAGKDDCILVTGSFYLAGELRKLWYPEEKILKNRRSF